MISLSSQLVANVSEDDIEHAYRNAQRHEIDPPKALRRLREPRWNLEILSKHSCRRTNKHGKIYANAQFIARSSKRAAYVWYN